MILSRKQGLHKRYSCKSAQVYSGYINKFDYLYGGNLTGRTESVLVWPREFSAAWTGAWRPFFCPQTVKDHASPSLTSVSLSNEGASLARGAGECNVQDGYAYIICFVIALPEACMDEELIPSSLEASACGRVRDQTTD